MLAFTIILLAVASAFFHIRAEYRGPKYQVYLFKPLTMVLILLIAIVSGGTGTFWAYKLAIITGLICSLVGDVFLMLPVNRFLAGLVSFLIAHLFYISAFTSGTGFSLSPWSLAPLVIFGIFIFTILSQHLGRMKVPVLVYMIVIIVMAWQAWERWNQTGQPAALLAFIGAGLFLVSDSALAINRFRGGFSTAQALILGTYFVAQCLIALSVEQGSLFSSR
ncbi:MAG: lysoplasmalogenase [Proteobacteria bacterium]|nr:lysoplasmalogenase [Pseudomonadota bacterium]NIS68255.1 lysoplasmalogenase [Pseudomonadota bacterium]